jgi:ABC-type Fe3+/spermidine/putrescine transport system ATPase subunit
MTLSDRVAVFNHGRIEQLATPQQLYDAPVNPFVAGFIGDNNRLAGHADVGSALRTPDGLCLQGRAAAGLAPGAAATLCVRPEHLRVALAHGPGADPVAMNQLPATLVDAIPLGDHWRLVARLRGSDATWFAKLAPGALPQGLAPGQEVALAFAPHHAWLFAA